MTANATAFIRANRKSRVEKSALLNEERRPKIGVGTPHYTRLTLADGQRFDLDPDDREHLKRHGYVPRWVGE